MQPITRFFSLILTTILLIMKKIYILLIVLLIPSYLFGEDGDGSSGNPYRGTITAPVTWNSGDYTDGKVYVGTSGTNDLTIGTGGHLTINNSVTVIFTQPSSNLIITLTGRLTVNGNSTNMVTFTKATVNSYWGHISFESMGSAGASLINYSIIELGDVSGNSGIAGVGGAIHVDFSDLTISNSIIRNNEAAWGGGIFVNDSVSPTISNCLIKNNASDRAGGGIYFWNGVGSVVENCIFDGNRCNETSSSSYSGGGICGQTGTSIKVVNCTFVNNTSYQTYGQSIELHSSSSARVINSIVWGSGNEIYLLNTNTVSIVNCAVEGTGASSYVNSIDLNSSNSASDGPNFAATDGSDWSIEFISPCRDIGTDTYTGISIPTTDYDGNNRIGTTDIGTYEVQYSRWKTDASAITDWTNTGNWEESLPPNDVDATGDVVIPALSNDTYAPDISSVTIASGKSMILEPGAKATFATLTNSGTLKLEADADSVASLIVTTFSGNDANIELYLTGGGGPDYKWHYVSSPFNSLDTTAFTAVTLNLANFDESSCITSTSQGWVAADGWIYSTESDGATEFGSLSSGKGYNFYDNVNNEITITGQLKTSNVPVALSFSDHGSSISGFNLLGNPFSSGLDWDKIVDSTYFDYPGSTSTGLYFTRDNVQCSYIGGVGSPSDVSGIIPPMQGFFVKTYSTGKTITLPAAARVHNSIHDRYKGKTIIPLVRLSILQTVTSTGFGPLSTTKDSISDETVVRFAEQAKPGLDYDFDAVKMFLSDNKLSIYSYTGETKYAINGLPFPEESINIPLAINSPKADTLKITATQIQGLEDYGLILKDLDQDFNINNLKYNEYIFFADSGTVTDRFILTVYKRTTGLPDIFEPEQEKAFNIYSSREILYIKPVKNEWNGKRSNLRIYDITGKMVKQQNNIEWQKGVTKEISLSVAQGIYLVEICSATDRFVGRVSVVR